MIKTIIFDFGGVLGSDSDDWEKAFPKIIVATGLSAYELEKIWDQFWNELKIGEKDISVFWREVIRRSRRKITLSELEKLYEEGVFANEDMLALAKRIKS